MIYYLRISLGVDFKKDCRSPILSKGFQESQESLVCRDNSLDEPYTPNIHAINSEDLIMGLKEFHKQLSVDESQNCPITPEK